MEDAGVPAWPAARNTVDNYRYLIACIILSLALHYAILSAFRGSLQDAAWNPVETGFAWLTVTLRLPAKVEPESSPANEATPPTRPGRAGETPFRKPAGKPLPLPVPASNDIRPSAPPASPTGELETAPHTIDFDAARNIAREAARTRNGVVAKELPPNLEPAKPEYETPLAQAIAKSARPDCKTKYAEMGFLAIPFLLRDTVTDSGCKW
jgi:hypothetical protein